MPTVLLDPTAFYHLSPWSEKRGPLHTSTGGELVTRFQLQLPATLFYDPINGGPPNGSAGVPFTPVGGTAAITGLIPPPPLADNASLLDISFNDFQPGESFQWDIDVDFWTGSVTVLGDDLIGAIATIDFSDGQRLTGILAAVQGNPDASQFTVTGITQTPMVPEPASILAWGLIASVGAVGYRLRKRKVVVEA